MKSIVWLKDALDKEQVGEKALNLAKLLKLKLPVPNAFIISIDVYERFLNKLKPEIESILEEIVDEDSLKEAVEKIKKLFIDLDLPEELKAEIAESYKKLDTSLNEIPSNFEFIRANRDPLFVAARSSSTNYVPDQQSNFLGIKGLTDLIYAIKHCWASNFNARAIVYRRKMSLEEPKIAIIIQKMINLTKSGIIFTNDPLTTDSEKILIESEYGFSKKSNPSQFLFDKNNMNIVNSKLRKQKYYYSRDGAGKITKQIIPPNVANISPLSEDDAKSLINMAKKIEDNFGRPQIIEWGSENRKLFLLQTHALNLERPLLVNASPTENMVLRGLSVFPSSVRGEVSIVNSKEDADNFVENNVLVTSMTNPYLYFVADKASAVITSGGGFASHAVQLSKELDKPCVIDAENATSVLKEGDKVAIDENGFIYREPKAEVEPEIINEVSGDLDGIFERISTIEKQVTELVYQDAEKRREGEVENAEYSKLLSDIEWDVREIKKKLQSYLNRE